MLLSGWQLLLLGAAAVVMAPQPSWGGFVAVDAAVETSVLVGSHHGVVVDENVDHGLHQEPACNKTHGE